MTLSARSLPGLVRRGESETLEFKESFDEEAMESVAAFANTRGGTVLVGVSDDGRVKGVQLGKETLRDWANRIAQTTRVNPRLAAVKVKGGSVVAIEAAESAVKPVPCRGRYFKRVDRSNRQMTDGDLTRAILDKVGSTWDEMADPRVGFDDLDPSRLDWFRRTCNEKGRRPIPEQKVTPRTLEKLGLLKGGRLSRAAALLFAKEPQRWFPSAMLKVGRFRSETLIVDDREIGGTIFDQVDSAMGYFRERLQTRFEFHGTPARDVIWEYPLDALREAVTNAVCHRDYLDVSQTQIRWHDDRLVIMNPGGLIPPLTPAELRREHASRPRNRKIAEMLYYAGWIEKWGGGTLAIIRDCGKAGLPEPRFEEKQGGLWLTLRPASTLTPSGDLSPSARGQTRGKTWEKIVSLLKTNPEATVEELARSIGVSAKGIEWNIQRLKSQGRLRRVGSRKAGRWEVLK
ncbi:MAG: putative DNA binding domain-containing protein [Elusimicrobia bacterium]|nr:putative DNA binding domain-containing protein [Elusimicrobiota bacterium]